VFTLAGGLAHLSLERTFTGIMSAMTALFAARLRSVWVAPVFIVLVFGCGARTGFGTAPVDAGLEPDTNVDDSSPPGDLSACILYTLRPDGTYGGGTTWKWNDEGSWTKEPKTLPTPSQCLPDACGYVGNIVSVGGRLLFIGAADASDATGIETWTWTDGGWVSLATVGAPPVRFDPSVAVLGDTVVLFGGESLDGAYPPLSDTWVLSGTTWTQESPATSPPARTQAAAAGVAGRVLLFGGVDDEGLRGDTWLWDGTSWTAAAGAGPTARSGAVAVAVGGGVLLFGGCAEGGILGCTDLGAGADETWLWTSADSWTELHPAASPEARNLATATSFGAGALLFGGSTGAGDATQLSDTWLWTGTTWAPREPALHPAMGQAAIGCD
jgi:hypothetical protein